MTNNTSKTPEWISLRQAACCTLTGAEPVFDAFYQNHEYPVITDCNGTTSKLMDAGSLGNLTGRGKFARMSVAFLADDDPLLPDVWLETQLRSDPGFILGWSVSVEITEIAPDMWQRHGCVYEKDTLIQLYWPDWNDPRFPKDSPQPCDPEYAPYQMHELVCITDVQIEVESFLRWHGALGKKIPGHNVGRAGAKRQVDHDEIKQFIIELLDSKYTWLGLSRLYEYIVENYPGDKITVGQDAIFKPMRDDKQFWPQVRAATKIAK